MDYATEIAKQGFGYVLFLGTLPVIWWQNKKINELQDKRISDANLYANSFISTAKDLLNGNNNLQRAVENITAILQNLTTRR